MTYSDPGKIVVTREGDTWRWRIVDGYGEDLASGPAADQHDAMIKAWQARHVLSSAPFPHIEVRSNG